MFLKNELDYHKIESVDVSKYVVQHLVFLFQNWTTKF